jgi:hypothetical protein
MQCALYLVGAVAALVAGQIWGTIMGFALCALMGLYYCCMQRRIAFTEKIMEPSVKAVRTYHGVFAVALSSTLLTMVYTATWLVTLVVVLDAAGETNMETDRARGIVFAMMLPLLWTTETFKNVTFVTATGAVGSWWLTRDIFSASASFDRASTKSLGSIAFGSLVVSVVTLLHAIVRSLRRDARDEGLAVQIALACLECLVGLLERLVRLLNKYAYVNIGLYGKEFLPAARDAFDLFKARGFDLLINDDLSGMAVGMGVLVCGLVNMLVVGLAWYATAGQNGGENAAAPIVIALIAGCFVAQSILAQVSAGVATTFVLWAQEPDALAQSRPEEYGALQAAREKMYV